MSCKFEILSHPEATQSWQVFCILVVCFLSVCLLGWLCVCFVFLGGLWALGSLRRACSSAPIRGFRARPGPIFFVFFCRCANFCRFGGFRRLLFSFSLPLFFQHNCWPGVTLDHRQTKNMLKIIVRVKTGRDNRAQGGPKGPKGLNTETKQTEKETDKHIEQINKPVNARRHNKLMSKRNKD